ncbi:acetyl-CoA carboxylase subunit beta [PVC group bacterium (ex Bugula neritina AB1)]|nr:acetyl-CoA carboxylase subunit beta [PVC group bacterium (ex Bugula neritina AB1)]
MPWFLRPKKSIKNLELKRKSLPDGLWSRCDGCYETVFNKVLRENFMVCPSCEHHLTLSAWQRVSLLMDKDSFEEHDSDLESVDLLGFKGVKSYKDKLRDEQKKTGLKDAILTGIGKIDGREVSFCVTDARFIMGSMGVVVGEKIARAVDRSIERKVPLIIVSGSGGGARMYEGINSLMQLAKTSAAISKLNQAGQLYISVLTNPTMAGIMASFASLGDITIAEPKALIGFTGPRVIEQTIKQKLPEGFQSSEFLLEHGFLDEVVARGQMKDYLSKVISLF